MAAPDASPSLGPSPEQVRAACAALGLALPPAPAQGLARYLGLLVKWNARMNLVGPADWRTILDTLAADSLRLAGFLAGLPLPADPLTLDLGSGAGLPGIPLRLVWDPGQYWLCEVRQKRVAFLHAALGELLAAPDAPRGIARTRVFHGRAEDLLDHIPGRPDRADAIVSRAFMPWPGLLTLTRPMLAGSDDGSDGTGAGTLVILANEPPPAEIAQTPGWRLTQTQEYPAPDHPRWFWSLVAAR